MFFFNIGFLEFVRRVFLKRVIKKILVLLCFILLFILFVYGGVLAYIADRAEKDTKVKSDVIMVLGGHVISGTSCTGPICEKPGFVMTPHYNPCVVSRVDHAVSLYKNGFAPKIIMSGGDDSETQANEAETMKKWAVEAGVPEGDILTEKNSTSTYENFSLSQKVITDAHLHSVIVVTESYHNARAELVASKFGYVFTLSPAVESVCWNRKNFFANWNFVKRESLALIGYKVSGKI